MTVDPLRVGLLGSGFVAGFHLQAFEAVRNVRVAGVYSPTPANRETLAESANRKELGPCQAYESVEAMISSGKVDAIWILAPNDARLELMRAVHQAILDERGTLAGVACEKPLGRNLAEAREMLHLAEEISVNHGYLENHVFSTAIQRGKETIWQRGVPSAGRPYLARAIQEHSGPHSPWFWIGQKQGGGALLDMMCHGVEACRYLLTEPGNSRDSLTPVSATASIATLKWSRPHYVQQLKSWVGSEVDYIRHPSEDFARGQVMLRADTGEDLIIEATASWSYVGPGVRIQFDLLGPEYAMELNTLNSGLKVFFSNNVGKEQRGEYLLEKQTADHGLTPVLEDEAATYGYTGENRHMVECFRHNQTPLETFYDGVAVVELLMALYRSAEVGRTISLPDAQLETYASAVTRGTYRG